MKHNTKSPAVLDTLPSTPIERGSEIYSTALALARAAGAVGPDQEPAELHYERATKVWHAKN